MKRVSNPIAAARDRKLQYNPRSSTTNGTDRGELNRRAWAGIDNYRQPEWTDGVNRDTGLEQEETARKCLSRLKPGVLIHLVSPDPPQFTVVFSNCLSQLQIRVPIRPGLSQSTPVNGIISSIGWCFSKVLSYSFATSAGHNKQFQTGTFLKMTRDKSLATSLQPTLVRQNGHMRYHSVP